MLELHVWGPAFGLPSIEPECIATILFCQSVVPKGQWSLIEDYDASSGAAESLPILFHNGSSAAAGFENTISYLLNNIALSRNPDANLTNQQQIDRTAFVAFLQSTATPLIDLLLYVSAENFNSTTSSAFTAILPWYANYTVPPKRRDLARGRTAHMGLSNLDVETTAEDGTSPGRGTASSDYEAAKRAAGVPPGGQPRNLNLGRKTGLSGLLSAPIYAARFRLDAFSNELLEPIVNLLGEQKYIFGGKYPSSLDCLAFGYLSLLFYPPVTQPWLRETMQSKYPRIVTYIHRLRQHFLNSEETRASDVWSISSGVSREKIDTSLPWQPKSQPLFSVILDGAREIVGNFPGVSLFTQRHIKDPSGNLELSKHPRTELPSPLAINTLLGVSAAFTVGMVALAIRHRHSPREGDLIFWALRPTSGLGEAGSLLSVLANQLPNDVYS